MIPPMKFKLLFISSLFLFAGLGFVSCTTESSWSDQMDTPRRPVEHYECIAHSNGLAYHSTLEFRNFSPGIKRVDFTVSWYPGLKISISGNAALNADHEMVMDFLDDGFGNKGRLVIRSAGVGKVRASLTPCLVIDGRPVKQYHDYILIHKKYFLINP